MKTNKNDFIDGEAIAPWPPPSGPRSSGDFGSLARGLRIRVPHSSVLAAFLHQRAVGLNLNLFQLHLRQRGAIALRDVRTLEAEEILNDIARASDPARETIKRIKTFLSGAFRYAKRMGILNGENPMRDTVLPRCRGGETHAYSLEQFLEMLGLLPEPAATIVALAGFAGLREGELKGARWENYREREIFVSKSVWRGHIDEPKTPQSMAPVPVVAQLTERLDAYHRLCGSPETGWMFPNSVGKPLCTAKLARDVIRPRLKQAGIEWHGWHAFRRGLATNLYRLGVSDKVIQPF